MRTEDDADETLMLRYRDGDADAFAALYARHKGALYRYLLRQCGQPALAEELFQDLWLKLIAARAGYTVQARFTTYLYRLAHNRLIDHYRASSRGLPLSYAEDCPEWVEVPAPSPSPMGSWETANLSRITESAAWPSAYWSCWPNCPRPSARPCY